MVQQSMPTHLESIQAFACIEAWANEARKLVQADPGQYSMPPLADFIGSLTGGVFLEAKLGEKDENHRALVSLLVNGPKKADKPVTRFMLPVHAALTRVLEIAGAKIKLIRGSGGNIEKYYFDMKVDKLRTNLHRPLFGMLSNGRLWERNPPHGYRYVVPSTYGAGEGLSRRGLLAAIDTKLAKRSKKLVVAEPSTVISVLTTLFAVADHWHWDELVGRPTSSDGERFAL
ncbi:hypothetical protein [Rhodopseudomonas palustris]|uniref:Uncharacterized protein n=1 Tax=Rhodopseudomonas palustris (strain BisB18) TaxID=316056 RepID=Q210J6_RHOPB